MTILDRFAPLVVAMLISTACFSPSEGYYPIFVSMHFVQDSDYVYSPGVCPDELSDLFGVWVTDSSRSGFTMIVPFDCSVDEATPSSGLSVPCELSGRDFSCGYAEEREACFDTADTGYPSEAFDEDDMTTISRGVALRGEWTSRTSFEAEWSSWDIDYESGDAPCASGPAVEEWAVVYFIYSELSDG